MPLFATVYSAFREMVTLLAATDPDLTPQKQKMFKLEIGKCDEFLCLANQAQTHNLSLLTYH